MKRSLLLLLAALLLLALLIALPLLIADPSITSIGVYVLLLTAMATAWNLFSGYTGYISLGHATYYGFGAYTMAMLVKFLHIPADFTPFLLLPLCGLVAALLALPLGWIALRTKHYAFVTITIAILFVMQQLAAILPVVGGARGIYLPTPSWGADFFDLPFYDVALALCVLAVLVSWGVRRSKYGLDLLAIRDDEERARSLGVATGRYKLLAYSFSACFMGMAGGLIVYYVGQCYPAFGFDPALDVGLTLVVFAGGAGTVAGPVVAGLLLGPLQRYLQLQFSAVAAGFQLVLFGALLLLTILFLPQGIVPSLHRLWSRWQTSHRRAAVAPKTAVGE